MVASPNFPTTLHRQVADVALEFFAPDSRVDTVLVVNSCARGRAIAESDVDLAVLVTPDAPANDIEALEASWLDFAATSSPVVRFKQSGPFAQVHLDLFDGRFVPTVFDDGGGPDSFEVEIGNRVAYSAPLGKGGPYFQALQARWLPYYEDDLRRSRLAMVRDACIHDLEYVPRLIRRRLHFHAFDRLYKAFQEFLQALFISSRVYPLAYNKWIREQVEERLGLPELYRELPGIISIREIESDELEGKAIRLRDLLGRWTEDLM